MWICDYITKTIDILAEKNTVIGFLWQDAASLREILINKKKFQFFKNEGNLFYLTPIHFLPFRRFAFIEFLNLIINSYLLKIFIFLRWFKSKDKILWLFHPDFWLLPKIFGKSYFSLYDCVDYFSSTDPQIEKKIRQNEARLIKNVQLMTVISQILKSLHHCEKKNTEIVPQGFSLQSFYSPQKLPQNHFIFKIKKPIIGYIGGINYRLDYPLLIDLAKKNPDYSFIFIGPFQKDPFIKFENQLEKLKKLKNVYFLGNQPRELLVEIIKYFDICSIPYDIKQEFNKFCYPMKVFEYFYLGKPVISTPIEELKHLQPYVKIAYNVDEFTKEIKKMLKNGWPKPYAQKQKELAIENSWANKIAQIDQILIKTIKDSA